jgi:hypothetical protein
MTGILKKIVLNTPSAPRETCELGLNEQKGEKKMDGKTSKAPSVFEQVKRVGPGLTARGTHFLFNSDLAHITNKPKTPLPPRPCPRFFFKKFFLVLFLPPKRGAGWGGRAARQGKRDKYSQEKNRFRTCRFAVF